MLDTTIALTGTGTSNVSGHTGDHAPMILAGGGFKHGSFIKTDAIIQNLFLSMLHQLGVEDDAFANSTGEFSDIMA